jgi:hypothetical protein
MKAFPKEDPEEESPWELVGIRRGTEYHPATDDGSGGVDRFVTSTEWDPPD